MTEKILDYKASVPNSISGSAVMVIPDSPTIVQLADLGMFITPPAPAQNRVELKATAGLTATGIAQVLFKIFRDDKPIFSSQQGVEAAEELYNVAMQTVDFNVSSGFHKYTLTAELLAGSGNANVTGPIVFSGLAIGPID